MAISSKRGILGIDTRDSIIYGEDKDKLIATIGLEDIVIVETEEALLVMPKGRAQEVRRLLELLRKRGFGELHSHG